MKIYDFIKYEGCGNDYIYIDCFAAEPSDEEKSRIAVKLSDRHFGVGGDGVVFVCASGKAGRFYVHVQRRRKRGENVRQRDTLRGQISV